MLLKQRLLAFVAVLLIVVIAVLSGQIRTEIISGIRQEVKAAIHGNRAAMMYWVAQRRAAIEATAERLARADDPIPFLLAGKDAGRFDQTFVGYENKQIIYHLADKTPPAGYNPTVRPWYIAAEKTRTTIITEPYICASTRQPCITVARSISSRTPSVVGGDISLEEIILLVNSIELRDEGYAFLATRDGKIVAHSKPDSALQPVDKVIPGFNAAFLKTADVDAHPHEFESEGVPQYVTAAPIPGTDWVLCLVFERTMALSPLRYLLGGLLLAGLIVAFLGIPTARFKTR
ncbi:MAG: cache domain-containing protein [Zoogloeaceae bacterium]|jgi:methyl-accepting chemotaxis protein|nr:cache domain-containing protein [Zoogloeaceae bacterium]